MNFNVYLTKVNWSNSFFLGCFKRNKYSWLTSKIVASLLKAIKGRMKKSSSGQYKALLQH